MTIAPLRHPFHYANWRDDQISNFINSSAKTTIAFIVLANVAQSSFQRTMRGEGGAHVG